MLSFITKVAVSLAVITEDVKELATSSTVKVIASIENAKEKMEQEKDREIVKYVDMYPEMWKDVEVKDYNKVLFNCRVKEARECKSVKASKMDKDMSIDAIRARIKAYNK